MLLLFFLCQYPEHTTDTVRVLGTRLLPGFSGAMTSLWITDSAWIACLPGQSIDRALLFSPGLWLRARGLPGVQSDIGAGPGNYTQTAIMVNGIRCDDPQTAHHNADLPLGLSDLERIEMARGGASGLAGPGASSGAVNLVTRDPLAGTSTEVFAGSFGTAGAGARVGNGTVDLGLSGARSDGYGPGSDYRLWRVSQNAQAGGAKTFASYSWKGFGAKDFYAPYPSREWTSCALFTLNWHGLSFGARRHTDRFVLLEDDPSFYENQHAKTSAVCSWNGGAGPGFGGWEISWWELSSDRLGYHQAPGAAMFYQVGLGLGPLRFAIGAREDWRDGTGFAPSLNGGISCTLGKITGRASGSLSTRFPSATEMYYQDPGNRGNPDLLPEKTKRAELGLSWRWISAGAFATEFENLIDWVRDSGAWEARNLTGAKANGAYLEARTSWFYAGWWCQMTTTPERYVSKYALRAPANSLKLGTPWLFISWEDGTCLVSGRLSFTRGPITLSLFGDNLLNQVHETVPGLRGPPRTVGLGLVFSAGG